jgi:hypothetical protein
VKKIGFRLDETTDVSICGQLLVFVRYVHQNAISNFSGMALGKTQRGQ